MTLKTTKKGPKFDSNKSVNEPTDKPGESRFEVEIPKGVQALWKQEVKIVQQDVDAYIRNKNADLERTKSYILKSFLATLDSVPQDIMLTPSEDFTKLVQK